jgi:hypothetical protein
VKKRIGEVLGIGIIPVPVGKEQVRFAVARRRPSRSGVPFHDFEGDADSGKVLLNGLGQAGIDRSTGAPQSKRQGGMACLGQESTRAFGIIRIRPASGIVTRQTGRDRSSGEQPSTSGHIGQHRLPIHRQIECAADPGILQRPAGGVDGNV